MKDDLDGGCASWPPMCRTETVVLTSQVASNVPHETLMQQGHTAPANRHRQGATPSRRPPQPAWLHQIQNRQVPVGAQQASRKAQSPVGHQGGPVPGDHPCPALISRPRVGRLWSHRESPAELVERPPPQVDRRNAARVGVANEGERRSLNPQTLRTVSLSPAVPCCALRPLLDSGHVGQDGPERHARFDGYSPRLANHRRQLRFQHSTPSWSEGTRGAVSVGHTRESQWPHRIRIAAAPSPDAQVPSQVTGAPRLGPSCVRPNIQSDQPVAGVP